MSSVYGREGCIDSLPSPPKVQFVDNHANVSLKECVADLLGHGLDVDNIMHDDISLNISSVSRIPECRLSRTIFNRGKEVHSSSPLVCLYITEWSDGIEPSYSTKANRGSCRIKTITISPMHDMMNTLTHTYPIASGRESDNHECIESKFRLQLNDFRTGKNVVFYHGRLKKNITVYLELLVSMQDQPERRAASYIKLGNSTYTAHWGVSLNTQEVASNIPSCK
jgi:hypothetical protein